MTHNRTQWKPLDVIFILLSALTIVLFVFWIPTQLQGKDYFNEAPAWLNNIAGKFWSFLATGSAAILTQWLNSNRSNGPNYLVWIMASSVFFLGMIYGTSKLFFMEEPTEEEELAQLLIELPYEDNLAVEFIQKSPTYRGLRRVAKQASGYYEVEVDLPDVDNSFFSKVAPMVIDSEITHERIYRELCFVRNDKCKAPHEVMYAFANQTVSIDEAQSSCQVKACLDMAHLKVRNPIVSFASYQQRQRTWTVPILENLKEFHDVGYSIFEIQPKNLYELIQKEVAYYTYQVVVNETPVLFNGFPAEDLRYDYTPDMSIRFGLQSLNFSGAHSTDAFVAGYEHINILLSLHDENTDLIRSFEIPLDYVAFRSFSEREQLTADDLLVSWQADFRSMGEKAYEVFIASSPNGNALKELKSRIDAKGFYYKNQRVVGVIRPPLRENPNYGIIVGLEKPSGQIEFDFNYSDASALLDWVREPEHIRYFREDAYLYNVGGQSQ